MSIFGRVRIYVFVLNENWMRVIFSLPKCWIVKHIEVEVAICRPEMLFRSTNSKINNHFVVSAIVWVRTYRMRFQQFQQFYVWMMTHSHRICWVVDLQANGQLNRTQQINFIIVKIYYLQRPPLLVGSSLARQRQDWKSTTAECNIVVHRLFGVGFRSLLDARGANIRSTISLQENE